MVDIYSTIYVIASLWDDSYNNLKKRKKDSECYLGRSSAVGLKPTGWAPPFTFNMTIKEEKNNGESRGRGPDVITLGRVSESRESKLLMLVVGA